MMSRWVCALAFLLVLIGPPAHAGEGDAAKAVQGLWKGLYSASFVKGAPGCRFDYGPEGMRNLYCYVVSYFQYADLARLSGLSPFNAGPHTNTTLNLESRFDFGRYNPAFVDWMTANLIPDQNNEDLRWETQPIYDRFMRNTARVFWGALQKMKTDPGFLDTEAQKLNNGLADKSLDEFWALQYYDYLGSDFYKRHTEPGKYFDNVCSVAVAFWIRRHLDGTLPGFENGLKKLLQAYDAEFLSTLAAASVDNTAAKAAARIAFVADDPIMVRFLADFIGSVEAGNWELALTFFSPENYEAQRGIGIDAPQYIEEGLGLNMVDNQLIPRPDDSSPFAKLNAIERIELTGAENLTDIGLIKVTGRAVLFDDSERRVELYLKKTATGGYLIEPPVG